MGVVVGGEGVAGLPRWCGGEACWAVRLRQSMRSAEVSAASWCELNTFCDTEQQKVLLGPVLVLYQ